jgi:hypothetical protein
MYSVFFVKNSIFSYVKKSVLNREMKKCTWMESDRWKTSGNSVIKMTMVEVLETQEERHS